MNNAFRIGIDVLPMATILAGGSFDRYRLFSARSSETHDHLGGSGIYNH